MPPGRLSSLLAAVRCAAHQGLPPGCLPLSSRTGPHHSTPVPRCPPLVPAPCLRADIVLNVESEQAGGMKAMLQHLLEFFKEHPGAWLRAGLRAAAGGALLGQRGSRCHCPPIPRCVVRHGMPQPVHVLLATPPGLRMQSSRCAPPRWRTMCMRDGRAGGAGERCSAACPRRGSRHPAGSRRSSGQHGCAAACPPPRLCSPCDPRELSHWINLCKACVRYLRLDAPPTWQRRACGACAWQPGAPSHLPNCSQPPRPAVLRCWGPELRVGPSTAVKDHD